MKRNLPIIFLSILACLLSLSGCSGKDTLSSSSPVTLTLWHVYGEQTDSPINHLIDEFNSTVGADQGIIVKITNATTTPDLKNLLLEAKDDIPGAPQMPDLFSARQDTVLNLGSEHLVDFSQYFSAEELSLYASEFIEDGTIDGKLLIFPVSRSTRVLFINDSLFSRFSADTGVTYEDLDTWEGLFAVAQQYYSWSGGKAFCAFDYLIQNVEYDILNAGFEPLLREDGWYDTADEHFKDSWMKFALPLSKGYIVVADKYANTQIMTGEVAAGVGSSAAINYYNDTVTYEDNSSEPLVLKVLPLPKTGSGKQYMPVTGTGFSSWKTTEEKAKAASTFLRWFTEGKRNLDFVVESGYMPVHDEAFDEIINYPYPTSAHETLFSAIKEMYQSYIPMIRPEYVGYYDKVELLYPGLRKICHSLQNQGETSRNDTELAEELWNFFLYISEH